ncbi:hypothetical protein L226DRAFT_583364 [Lentinus tigrinus ALCF2SS1-7]|uniref:Mid2 domain-containing protein n=1 Tax=Lentinus tigrinus ALCF2SS1-6 TaxID=1328759 RepID=A0A5C2RYK7_9APHY|nr:hypothetical protein L227DRAFT_636025 [Lentinus tigrinus ALCF2SS1-6]RPD73963.1 hypothetical protein L226DRAFT_583364 [Lentinus tigrinus ALCF2SS1-7]
MLVVCVLGASITSGVSANITSSASSNGTIISLPSVTSSSIAFNTTSTSFSLSVTPSINSQFTFVTDTSLAVASQPSSTGTPTSSLTDPDEPTTTFTVNPSSAADTKPTQAPLPSGLPTQIFPAEGSKPSDPDLSGYSLISLLFDSGLNWEFVVKNTNSSSQIFAWMSPLLQASLSLTADQVKTYQLRVHVPDDYKSAADIGLLETMWLAWIPNQSVDVLAQQLKVLSSAFYTALSSPYSDLAKHVVSTFPVTSVSTTTDNGSGSGSGSGSSDASSSGASSSSKTRENAIIGVVTSLGAITLLILGFLVFRAIKQRRELAHRRLSDPHEQEFVGAPPDDHEFDRDSVGGQRRRSFYYAADSLRTAQDHNATGAVSEDPFNPNMRERRPVIGTPILRDNTMNW